MSIDLTKVTGISDDYGVITQITDAAGNVLWSAVRTSGNVILEVEKLTLTTFANETTYTDEEFVLLDIYPKTNGTVTVTYGGLTKTITDTIGGGEPNAQQVFFGTFYGVSDSVETPASGTLTIEGDYRCFAIGTYKSSKVISSSCPCITKVKDFGTVEIIPNSAFGNLIGGGCKKITSVTIPNSVISIGDGAFTECTGLTSVTIPSSVTSIGNSAFYGCTGLTSITIPSSVTSVVKNAFYGCTGLTSITIPSSVTSIGIAAFGNCTGLTSIIVDSGNEYYSATDGILFNKDKTELCAYPSANGYYTIPSSVTSIAGGAFYGCTGLTSITIPSSVTSIGEYAFYGCTGLTSITIPSSVTSIGEYAFGSCRGLTSITIPSSVTSIAGGTFYGCTGLTSITIPSSVTSIGGNAFYLTSGNTRTVIMLSDTPPTLGGNTVFDVAGTNNIVLKNGGIDAYKAAEYWSEYADYITEAA